MVEVTLKAKQDEQYPLLKVDGGGGDGSIQRQAPVTVVTSGWSVTTATKQSWLMRWPEYVSACWMTFILLGISFLVFYALAMESYRRQPVLIVKCNTSKPASDVYFHHILQRENPAPFIIYSEYLASMAVQYPFLEFHVIFLIDDTFQTSFRGPRHNRFINKLLPYSSFSTSRLDETNKRELRDFRRKYQNVNVTIIPLSKFMAMTPLKYKWRTIPLSYITFYARIFSVWQNGGIGMDLNTFNNNFNNRQFVDRRVSAIMKQHNDGIKPEEYANSLNKIDREDENEFFSMFYGLIHQVLNETRSFLSKNFAFTQIDFEKDLHENKSLIRTHRNKRDYETTIMDKNLPYDNKSSIYVEFINNTNTTDFKRDEYYTLSYIDLNIPKVETTESNDIAKQALGNESITKDDTIGSLNTSQALETNNKSDIPQVVLFYDFSILSNGLAPSYSVPESLLQPSYKSSGGRNSEGYKTAKQVNSMLELLSIDAEGTFVAASLRMHPFLGYLITAGCQRIHPKFAIQDALITQCSGIFREELYCNNIYLL